MWRELVYYLRIIAVTYSYLLSKKLKLSCGYLDFSFLSVLNRVSSWRIWCHLHRSAHGREFLKLTMSILLDKIWSNFNYSNLKIFIIRRVKGKQCT